MMIKKRRRLRGAAAASAASQWTRAFLDSVFSNFVRIRMILSRFLNSCGAFLPLTIF